MFKKNKKYNYQITLVLFLFFSNLFCFDKLVGIMVDFVPDEDPQTSGDGTFLNAADLGFIHYEDKQRCSDDNFLVEKPPHNSDYFLLQMKAVQNYYESISVNSINFDIEVLDTVFTMNNNMKFYSTSDNQIGLLFSDAIDKVYDAIDQNIQLKVKNTIEITDFNDTGNILFIVFHAGLGQESSTDFDPTIYDIRSAYVDEAMLDNNWVVNNGINKGVVLPETLNMIYYDTIEDNIPISTDLEDIDNIYCNSQYGMSGLFAYLLGYSFGFPPLHNFENGQTRVGKFDLMDIGFFNGRGVIPSPPSAWIRSNNNFNFNTSVINITSDAVGQAYEIPVRLSNAQDIVYRMDISSSEYFLIEHRSNLLDESLFDSIDERFLELRNNFNDYNDGDSSIDSPNWFDYENSVYGPSWFDVFFNEFGDYIELDSKDDVIPTIDSNNHYGIITKVSNYDAGLPGSGLLIWHINEPIYDIVDGYSYGINDNILNKAITLEEGDGSQDIGELNPGIIALFENEKFQSGKGTDFWYPNNSEYIGINNVNNFEGMLFNNNSFPNTKSISDVSSNISIEILPKESWTPDNIIRIKRNNDLDSEILDILIIEDLVDVLGNNGEGCIFYLKSDGFIYKYCDTGLSEQVYFLDNGNNEVIMTDSPSDIADYSIFIDSPEIITYQNQSFLVDQNQNYYYDEDVGQILNNQLNPIGFYNVDLINEDNPIPLEVSEALALANLDDDVYHEKVFISNGNLNVQNYGGSSISGFPLYGSYTGVPLILNVFNDYQGPEIIAFNSSKIDIISSNGDILYELPIFDDSEISALRWNADDIAIVNGSRLYIFNNSYDENQSFWMNYNSRPSNFPEVTDPNINFITSDSNGNEGIDLDKVYNYPNPIKNNKTTFRFFVINAEKVEINIFDITGTLIAKLFKDNLILNEYNEIIWDSFNLPIGLYFASVKSDKNQSKVLKVVVE